MGKYFNVTVKPTIAASKQALAAFADGDVLFDWTAFDVPKGSNRLMTAMAISKNADGAVNAHALNLIFAKTVDNVAPTSIGTIHATANGEGYYNHLLATMFHETADNDALLDNVGMHVFNHNRMGTCEFVLTGEPESGTNFGYDRLYVASTSIDDTPTFASTIQCDGIQAITQNVLTVKTTSAARTFAPGDIIHDEDDRLLGTVKTVDSSTQMTMVDNLANATVNNKDCYNINPYIIHLSFER